MSVMEPATSLRLAQLVLSNPFHGGADQQAAQSALATLTPKDIESLSQKGHDKEARRVAVAIAVAELGLGRQPALLQTRGGGSRILANIGLDARSVADTANGAVRCTRALRDLAGVSSAIHEIRATVWRSCFGESVYEAIRLRPLIREQNVLLLGETGTGKELVAQAIARSHADGHQQAINAAAIPRDLLESELFGHVRGAFSGAHGDREGKISAAHGGTLFLDEIADLPEEMQVKLLRVIEEGKLTPVGSNKEMQVDIRYVSATSQALAELARQGKFRNDLYQRLAGVIIEIPPLRERPEDLRPIADQLFRRHAERLGQSESTDSESTAHLSRLTMVQARFCAWLEREDARSRPWMGNVRELQSLIRSWVLGFSETSAQSTAANSAAAAPAADAPLAGLARFIAGEGTLRELEDWYIGHVCAMVDFKQRKAARILDVDRGTLSRRLKQIDEI